MSEENSNSRTANTSVGEAIRQRALELRAEGLDFGRAWNTAWLEHRVQEWPADWGDDLQVLIYGDFEAPKHTLQFPTLGISIHPEKVENSVIKFARCVLKASVKVEKKSVPALLNATRRVNVLLGSWTLVTWGNSPIRWWSWVTHDWGSGVIDPLYSEELEQAIKGVLELPEQVQRRIEAALYWIREPKSLLMEPTQDLLRVYFGYWNAFECLVDAWTTIRPQAKLSKAKKQQQIDKFFAQLSRNPGTPFMDDSTDSECHSIFAWRNPVPPPHWMATQAFPLPKGEAFRPTRCRHS